MTASATGLPVGLCSEAHGDDHVVALLQFGRDGLEGVVVGAGQCGGTGQAHRNREGGGEQIFRLHVLDLLMASLLGAALDVIERQPNTRASLRLTRCYAA